MASTLLVNWARTRTITPKTISVCSHQLSIRLSCLFKTLDSSKKITIMNRYYPVNLSTTHVQTTLMLTSSAQWVLVKTLAGSTSYKSTSSGMASKIPQMWRTKKMMKKIFLIITMNLLLQILKVIMRIFLKLTWLSNPILRMVFQMNQPKQQTEASNSVKALSSKEASIKLVPT